MSIHPEKIPYDHRHWSANKFRDWCFDRYGNDAAWEHDRAQF